MPANPTPAEGVVVPLEPTEAMIDAGLVAYEEPSEDEVTDVIALYLAMLAARPAAPTQSAAQTGEVVKELVADLDRRADACHDLNKPGLHQREAMRLHGKEAAYRNASRLVHAALSQPETGRYDMPTRQAGIRERARMNMAAGDLFSRPTTQEGPNP